MFYYEANMLGTLPPGWVLLGVQSASVVLVYCARLLACTPPAQPSVLALKWTLLANCAGIKYHGGAMHSQTTPRWMAAISLVAGSAAEAPVSQTDRDTLNFQSSRRQPGHDVTSSCETEFCVFESCYHLLARSGCLLRFV